MAHKRLTLAPHLRPDELKARYRQCRDAKEGRRWHALWGMSAGASAGGGRGRRVPATGDG